MRSTTERGYGNEHQREKRRWQRQLDHGAAIPCSCRHHDCRHHTGPCPTVILAGMDWDLGHADDRESYTGPECVPCNRSAGGRNGNRVKREREMTVVRDW